MQGEGLKTTAHNKIFIGDIEDVTEKQLEEKIAILKEIIQDENIKRKNKTNNEKNNTNISRTRKSK